MGLAEVLWTMLVFFFWFMAIWIFIQVLFDVFRREDLTGWWKAIWIVIIFVLPLLGCLIYLIVRPKMTEQDKRELEAVQTAQRRMAGYSVADEIAKLTELRDKGAISAEEFEALKARAM
jgi:signal transduction histidine kinase